MTIPAFDLVRSFDKFIDTLKWFPSAAFIKKSSPASWSAAEIAEHIAIINNNLIQVLQAKGEAADRPADKKLTALLDALQDRQTKRIAPENVIPTGLQTDPAMLIATLQTQKAQLQKIVANTDHQELCTVYPHPRLGRLTRLEWFHFIAAHTERHRLQLEQVAQEIGVL